ncbi:MAG: integrase family protein [Deltaproteobacteria bacterium]|nr:integrase family protein [Deltaproteobacteria bacterium]
MARLNEKTIAGLPSPAAGVVEHSDDEVRGLRLVVSASGRKSWHLKYRLRQRKRTLCLGPWPELTTRDAREMAMGYRSKALRGEDPADERRGMAKDVTFGKHAEQYLEHAREKGKRSVKDDVARLRLWILPALGRLPLASITKKDCERVEPGHGARLGGADGGRGVGAPREERLPRGREAPRAAQGDLPHARGAGQAAGGARRRRQPARGGRDPAAGGDRVPEDGDLLPDVGTLRLEAGMTKNGRRRLVLLNDIAKETLGRAVGYRRPGSDFVFPADNRQGRVSWAQRSWERAKRRAGIDPKIRLHDLRDSVGSLLGHSYPEAVVAKMLGHLDSRTTSVLAIVDSETSSDGNRISALGSDCTAEITCKTNSVPSAPSIVDSETSSDGNRISALGSDCTAEITCKTNSVPSAPLPGPCGRYMVQGPGAVFGITTAPRARSLSILPSRPFCLVRFR